MDNTIREQFHIGGTGVNLHKYIGPIVTQDHDDPSQPNYIEGDERDPFTGELTNPDGYVNETKIQDILFLENRDRKYDPNIYDLRGIYNVQDTDFDLNQFSLFLSNDQFYMTFHLNEMVEIIGRKIMSGDVLELPHIRDYFGLDVEKDPIMKYYTVTDASRGAEGFSQTWYPHIWRVKLSPINDQQEYQDILGSNQDPESLNSNISTYREEFSISDIINEAAQMKDPDGTMNTDHLYGYDDAVAGGVVIQNQEWDYGEPLQSGTEFPSSPLEGTYFLRTDFVPNRLFVRRGSIWHKIDDNINSKTWNERTHNASDYIYNDQRTTVINNQEFKEKTPLSEVILPKKDT